MNDKIEIAVLEADIKFNRENKIDHEKIITDLDSKYKILDEKLFIEKNGFAKSCDCCRHRDFNMSLFGRTCFTKGNSSYCEKFDKDSKVTKYMKENTLNNSDNHERLTSLIRCKAQFFSEDEEIQDRLIDVVRLLFDKKENDNDKN